MSGSVSYHAGLVAEEMVAADYARRGLRLERRRWRGKRGEIDLILREDDRVIFVEVKKSRDFARAAESLSQRQVQRILGAAEEFVANEPKGLLTEMRFDLAMVDALGRIEILENACLAA